MTAKNQECLGDYSWTRDRDRHGRDDPSENFYYENIEDDTKAWADALVEWSHRDADADEMRYFGTLDTEILSAQARDLKSR